MTYDVRVVGGDVAKTARFLRGALELGEVHSETDSQVYVKADASSPDDAKALVRRYVPRGSEVDSAILISPARTPQPEIPGRPLARQGSRELPPMGHSQPVPS